MSVARVADAQSSLDRATSSRARERGSLSALMAWDWSLAFLLVMGQEPAPGRHPEKGQADLLWAASFSLLSVPGLRHRAASLPQDIRRREKSRKRMPKGHIGQQTMHSDGGVSNTWYSQTNQTFDTSSMETGNSMHRLCM